MHAEAVFPLSTLLGFLFVLARVAGVFIFIPVPGFNRGVEMARAALALGITLALYPRWPAVEAGAPLGAMAFGLIAEAALGITIGMAVAFLLEAFLFGAQMIATQAGFSYASMVDPTTNADSGVLLVFAQLAGGMLFLALGLDREVLRSLAASLDVYPPGAFLISRPLAETVARMGAVMFSSGLRLAFPILALLVMVDLALALLGRLQPNLQLLILAFPAKMLAALALFAWMAVLLPKLFLSTAGLVFTTLRGAVGF
jgi:flagellar biosynthetic protein FliR